MSEVLNRNIYRGVSADKCIIQQFRRDRDSSVVTGKVKLSEARLNKYGTML